MKKLISVLCVVILLFATVVVFSACTKTGFENKSYLAFGDSITEGDMSFSGEKLNSPYPKAVAKRLKIGTLVNRGVGGLTVVSQGGRGSMVDVIFSQEYADYDIISLMGGVNDFGNSFPLGTPNDATKDTIYGAYDVIAKHLTTTYPDAFIFFMTPLKCGWWSTPTELGYTLVDVRDAMVTVANRYGIPVLDTFNESIFDPTNVEHTPDTVHPSQWFVDNELAPMIAEYINCTMQN